MAGSNAEEDSSPTNEANDTLQDYEAPMDEDDDRAFMTIDSKKSSISNMADDGLGVDFLETTWEEPSIKLAEIHQHMHMFEGGKLGACSVRHRDFGTASIGVRAQFELLHALGCILMVCFILAILPLSLSQGLAQKMFGTSRLSPVLQQPTPDLAHTINASLTAARVDPSDNVAVALAIQNIEVPFGLCS